MKSFKFNVKNERFAYICLHAKLIVNLVILQCCFAKNYVKKETTEIRACDQRSAVCSTTVAEAFAVRSRSVLLDSLNADSVQIGHS